ncbi:hypothetical protein VPH35_127848 [Triticum aestivum]
MYHIHTSMCLDHIISGIRRARRKVILNPRESSSGYFAFPLLLLFSLLYIILSLGRSHTDKSNHLLAPPIRIGAHTERPPIDSKTGDQRDILERHGHLPGPKMETMGLWSPPINKSGHQWSVQIRRGPADQQNPRE